MFKDKKILFLIIIFLLAFFLRFFKLGEIPYGFYQDESAIGYNAYSIMLTGKDEHGEHFPLYFKSFGDYKLPIYIYLTTASIKIFGLNEFAVRFPSAFFGFLTVIAFYFFVKQLCSENSKHSLEIGRASPKALPAARNLKLEIPIIATAMLAINPWHLHYSRATFEVVISLFLFIVGGLLLHKALTKKRKGLFPVGSLFFVTAIYTYNLTRLLSPLLFGLFLIMYRKELRTLARPELIATVTLSIIFLSPFIITLLQGGGVASARGTFIFSSAAVQAPLLEFRSYFVELPSLFTKSFFNQWAQTLWQYINNIINYFSVPFFFISGSPHGNHGIGNVGQFYLFEFPLIILGILQVFRQKFNFRYFFVSWALLIVFIASLTRESPHATRSFFLLAPFVVFSALGLITFWTWAQKQKENYKIIFVLIAGGFIFYNLVFYFSSYYVRFPVFYAKSWRAEDKALSLYIKNNQAKYDKIIFDKKAGFVYTSLLFYTTYSPYEFQKTVKRQVDNSEGFSEVLSFGKYEFKDIDWVGNAEKNALIITTPDRKPEGIATLKTFFYPRRPVVISVGQKINQYPVNETAYVVVQTK